MIKGQFTGNLPIVKVKVISGRSTQDPVAVLDTGFSGDLQLTPRIAHELRLEIGNAIQARTADGHIVSVATAGAHVSLEGIINPVQVLISEGLPLVGINFLTRFGYTAIVDCKNRTVELEKSV